jgi:osmotically-inducible protein OsmY
MDAPVKDGATLKDHRDDTAITTKVKAALTNDKYTSGATDAIHVQTDGGVVTLTGDVASQATAVHAQTLVAQLTGVRDVVNDLKYPHPANGVTSSPMVARLQPRTNRNRKSRICARSSI